DPTMAHALAATLASRAYDLLQVEYGPMAEYAPRRGAGPRGVWTVHELGYARLRDELAHRRGPVRALLAYRYLQMLRYELSLTARFDLIVAIAEAEARELRERGAAAPVVVSPMGVDTRAFPPAPPEVEEPGLILLVGFFGHAPNVDAARWFVGDVLPRVRVALPPAGQPPGRVTTGTHSLRGTPSCTTGSSLRGRHERPAGAAHVSRPRSALRVCRR